MMFKPLPNIQHIEQAIARLRDLIPAAARVGFYPSCGTNINVFNFNPLPLDYVICSDYDVAEVVQGKIITVKADNNLCLRYIIEAGIKLEALFAIQDGGGEGGGNYEFVNAVGFLGRALPALKKSFVLVNNQLNKSYTPFDKGPVKRINGNVAAYHLGSYSVYDPDAKLYDVHRYEKNYHAGRKLGFEEKVVFTNGVTPEVVTKKFMKIHYKSIWEDQRWLDGIFVRKHTLTDYTPKESLKKYWPNNLMPAKVHDMSELTTDGSVLPLLEFANKHKLNKIGLVDLTGKKERLFPYHKHFDRNYQEFLDWTKQYPNEIHLYYVHQNSYQYAINTSKNFPHTSDFVVKPIDENYLKILYHFFESVNYFIGDARISGMLDLYVMPQLKSLIENGNFERIRQHVLPLTEQDRRNINASDDAYEVEDLQRALATSSFLAVKDKGFALPPACLYVSKSGRYSVHDLYFLRQDQGYVLWDNLRKVLMPDLFHDLYGVDEENDWVFGRSMNSFHQPANPSHPLKVSLDFIEMNFLWKTVQTNNIVRAEDNNDSLSYYFDKRAALLNIYVDFYSLIDLSNVFAPPDYFKIRKAAMKKLLFEDISEEVAFASLESIFDHPFDRFWGDDEEYQGYFSVILELLDPSLKNGFFDNNKLKTDQNRLAELIEKFRWWREKYKEFIESSTEGLEHDDLPF